MKFVSLRFRCLVPCFHFYSSSFFLVFPSHLTPSLSHSRSSSSASHLFILLCFIRFGFAPIFFLFALSLSPRLCSFVLGSFCVGSQILFCFFIQTIDFWNIFASAPGTIAHLKHCLLFN